MIPVQFSIIEMNLKAEQPKIKADQILFSVTKNE